MRSGPTSRSLKKVIVGDVFVQRDYIYLKNQVLQIMSTVDMGSYKSHELSQWFYSTKYGLEIGGFSESTNLWLYLTSVIKLEQRHKLQLTSIH
jgi:hypothetical protein